jgi:hypothetical protein
MKQNDQQMREPKFKKGDLVRVSDVNSPFFRWELGVEKSEVLRHAGHAPGKTALVELQTRFYICSHTFMLTRPNDVTLNLFFREDQLEEVPF